MFATSIQELLHKADAIVVPAVNAYHDVKENVFLNTQYAGAKGLEAAGNFFLRYSIQYLFNGRTITHLEPIKSHQTFNYQTDCSSIEFLKTAVAALALPLLLLLGSVLKGISYLSSDVRQRHKTIETDRHTAQKPTDYTRLGINAIFSNEVIPHQGCPHPELTKKQKVLMQAVYDVAALLEQQQIPHWLDFGSLLGAYRHGSMIPWDPDVDIGMLSVDHENVRRILQTLDPKKYALQNWSCAREPGLFLRVLIKEENSYLDLYHYKIEPGNETLIYKYSWADSPWVWKDTKEREIVQQIPIPLDDFFPLKKVQFGNRLVSSPAHLDSALHQMYGGRIDPCKIWNPAVQQYEKVADHPYWLKHAY
ncbi:MAG TPA: LicD family protein [Chlamydiales bacterium]|nr:LicD family protein [Chlamydiales bacterium]